MANKRGMEIIDRLLDGIWLSREWSDILNSNPLLQERDARLESICNRLKDIVPASLLEDLQETVNAYNGAVANCALLYGIHIAEAIREASANPREYFQYLIEKLQKKAGAV